MPRPESGRSQPNDDSGIYRKKAGQSMPLTAQERAHLWEAIERICTDDTLHSPEDLVPGLCTMERPDHITVKTKDGEMHVVQDFGDFVPEALAAFYPVLKEVLCKRCDELDVRAAERKRIIKQRLADAFSKIQGDVDTMSIAAWSLERTGWFEPLVASRVLEDGTEVRVTESRMKVVLSGSATQESQSLEVEKVSAFIRALRRQEREQRRQLAKR